MLPLTIIVVILSGAFAGQYFFGNQSEEAVGKHSAERKA